MKESIGYTVTLNIMIVFITIIIAFLCTIVIYFKSNKVSNIITSAIEKHEGYVDQSRSEIAMQLSSIGYGSRAISCSDKITDDGIECNLASNSNGRGKNGYCIYLCYEENNFKNDTRLLANYLGDYYYYRIRTNMMFSIPIIHDVLDIPIYSNTNRLYNFKKR